MSSSPLNRLPLELREQIFRYIFVKSTLAGAENRGPTNLLAALRSSSRERHLYFEALQIYHQQNMFCICPENEFAVGNIPDNIRSSIYHLILFFHSTAQKGRERRFVEFRKDLRGRIAGARFGSNPIILRTILPQIDFNTTLHGFTNLRCLNINCVNVLEGRFFSVQEFVFDALHKLTKLEEFGILVYPYMAYEARDAHNRKIFMNFHKSISKGLGCSGKAVFLYDETRPMDEETSSTPLILVTWRTRCPGSFLSWKDSSKKHKRI